MIFIRYPMALQVLTCLVDLHSETLRTTRLNFKFLIFQLQVLLQLSNTDENFCRAKLCYFQEIFKFFSNVHNMFVVRSKL